MRALFILTLTLQSHALELFRTFNIMLHAKADLANQAKAILAPTGVICVPVSF